MKSLGAAAALLAVATQASNVETPRFATASIERNTSGGSSRGIARR